MTHVNPRTPCGCPRRDLDRPLRRAATERARLITALVAAGCHVDEVESLTDTGFFETSSSSVTLASADSTVTADPTMTDGTLTAEPTMTGSPDDTSSEEPPEACLAIEPVASCSPFPAPAGVHAADSFVLTDVDTAEICPCVSPGGGTLPAIYVTHPVGWPEDPATAPVVVFHHGNSQSAVYYDFSALAAAGFVVLNVETAADFGDDAEFGLACALEFARSSNVLTGDVHWREATDCNLIVAGHSLGAHHAGNILAGAPTSVEHISHIMGPYALRAGFLFAPELRPESVTGGPVPILIVASAADPDINEDPIRRYDRVPLEDDFSAAELPRALIYSWGPDHSAFGGGGSIAGDTGQAIVDGYVPAFAAAMVHDDPPSTATWWSYLTRASYPAPVLDPSVWDETQAFTLQSPVHCALVPLEDCDITPGCEPLISDCVQIACAEVDPLDCAATPGCVMSTEDECMALPRLRTSYTADQAAPGTQRQPIEFFEAQAVPDHRPPTMAITVDDATAAIGGIDFVLDGADTGHETSLLLVEWGGSLGDPGEVFIDLPAGIDLADYSHLSLRVGNVLDKIDSLTECEATSTDAVSFELALREAIDGEILSQSSFTSTGRIVQNDVALLDNGIFDTCAGQQTMTTIRFPLAPFCSGVGATAANQLVLRFPETTEASRVLIDTIELTASPLDTSAECGTFAAGWHCTVDELVVTETSCTGEPTPTCDSGDVTTDTVLAPLVEPVGDDAYRGWYVQTPAGAVVDPEDPTEVELAHVLARCVTACQIEYAANPDVAANCDDPGAFLDPAFATYDAQASHHAIPEDYIHGGGIYPNEVLDCDLRTDCCEAFDEDLCATRLARVTEAGEGLGRGEQWRYGMTGVLILDSPAMAEPVVGDLSGSMGGSRCAAGNGTAACPIYLGSADIELDDPVTVTLTCGGQTVQHTLDALDLSLAQPAFGINSHTYPQWSAFPPGGMIFDAHTVVDDTLEFDTYLPIEEKVGLMFNDGWATVPMYGNFEVTFDLPCNGETVGLLAAFELTATSWQGSPPSGTITVPSTVSCPSSVTLAVSTMDAEDDIASIRWRVDDVLLNDAVTAIDFTMAHDLTAVIRDSRGATTTITKHVDCT